MIPDKYIIWAFIKKNLLNASQRYVQILLLTPNSSFRFGIL